MTGNDLIVAAPWIIFGAGLSAVWIRLLRARHASRHRPGRSRLPFPGPGRLRRSRAQASRPGDVPAARRRAVSLSRDRTARHPADRHHGPVPG